jgi:hypothetical protein
LRRDFVDSGEESDGFLDHDCGFVAELELIVFDGILGVISTEVLFEGAETGNYHLFVALYFIRLHPNNHRGDVSKRHLVDDPRNS